MQRVVVHENQHVKCIVHSIRLGGQTRFQHISDSMVSNQTFTNGKLKESKRAPRKKTTAEWFDRNFRILQLRFVSRFAL